MKRPFSHSRNSAQLNACRSVSLPRLHRDADAFAEIAALEERPAGEGAAAAGIGAVEPERQRDAVAEHIIDLAALAALRARSRR